jgi:D-serine deaminase-like pyridoxal phosphate-dependent protein
VSGLTASLETPAAVVDLARLERNLERWQAHCDRVGLASRPHVKTHKCVEIARRQLELGATGLTCQTLGEAETMAAAGCENILISYNLVGRQKLERLGGLLEAAQVTVTVDDAALLAGLDHAAAAAGRELVVLVECDTGLGRTGVQSPEAAVRLAGEVARRPSLRFEGFLTHPSLPAAGAFLAEAVEQAERRALPVTTVSAGGTPAMWDAERLRPTLTEYRAGTYAFHDRMTVAAGAAELDDVALTVATTVISRPTDDRAVLDAGSKALSSDRARGSSSSTRSTLTSRSRTASRSSSGSRFRSSRTTPASSRTSPKRSSWFRETAWSRRGRSTRAAGPCRRSLSACRASSCRTSPCSSSARRL